MRQGNIEIEIVDRHIGKIKLAGQGLGQLFLVNIAKFKEGFFNGNIALLADFFGVGKLLLIYQLSLKEYIISLRRLFF